MVHKSQDPIPKNHESHRRDVSVLALSDSGLWLFGDSQRNFVPRISEFRTEIFNFNNDTRTFGPRKIVQNIDAASILFGSNIYIVRVDSIMS